ncbi:hypothetical protein G3570_03395 [Balneolaceae bacterium YR4-1]|uniref:Uncharacterized protein n=1 Tax=Halalkalibaculum roseum TaxID=2709311 RepID=A0A6M1SK38_9BACT|nr:hypothetical protein [Halalkalibaculum roseum]NGP75661.1 hypothetical protein [Halalkalibaculum roseum]
MENRKEILSETLRFSEIFFGLAKQTYEAGSLRSQVLSADAWIIAFE